MIIKKELESIGFRTKDGTLYHDYYRFDFEYNIKSQYLYDHDEVDGKIEFICRVMDIHELRELTEYYIK